MDKIDFKINKTTVINPLFYFPNPQKFVNLEIRKFLKRTFINSFFIRSYLFR